MERLKRQQLLDKARSLEAMEPEGRQSPLPVVSLDDFFEGNDDPGSIGCNLLEDEHPGVAGFYKALEDVSDRPDVHVVLVEFDDLNDEDEADGDDTAVYWPFSECVYVLTSVSKEDVERWLEGIHPSDIVEEPTSDRLSRAFPPVLAGMRVYWVWGD
jgi:hypothetical protein